MKILQLVTRRQYRGAEVFAANLSLELLKKGDEVIFLGLFKPEDPVLSVAGALNDDLNGKPGAFMDYKVLRKLTQTIRIHQPDIIQANGSDTLKYAVFAGFLTKRSPLIYRNISIISSWIGTNFLKQIFYRFLFSRVHHVSSVGETAIKDLIKCLNYSPAKTSVIRRGIPLEVLDKKKARIDLIQQFELEKDDKIAIHIGNFSPEKNHKFILKVFSFLKERNNIKLLLVGNGQLFPEIKSEIKRLELERTVFLAGFRKDTTALLAASDLLVLFSTVEGIPGVILEAATQYVTSLAVNVGGVPEIVRNNQTGILINGFNERQFSQTLVELLDNDLQRANLGTNAYHMVKHEFNPDGIANQFQLLYNKLIQADQ